MKNHFTHRAMLLGGALLLANSNSVRAQSDNADNAKLETIEVIGTRQAYRGDFTALETPQANLTISAETLRDAGALNFEQALDLSASVARQNNFGGLWNSFAVRGFVGDGNLPSNYLVNGFNAGRGFAGPRDLAGIESVEVLKGPRAALFGRGEPGGTINLVTKRPTFDTRGELILSAGSFDTYRGDADYTTPLTDAVAVRLIGFYEDAQSFRDTVETKKRGFFPSLTWKISDQSQLNYEIEYSDQEIPLDRGVIAIDGELGVIPQSRFLGEPGDGPIEAEVVGHQLEFQHDLNDTWSALLGVNLRDSTLRGFVTENGFSAPDDNGDFGRFRRYRDYDGNYQVLRAEISGSFVLGGLEHRIIAGVDADEFENDQVLLRIRDRDDPSGALNQDINIFNPVYGAYPLPVPLANTDRVETQKSKGLYIQDQISLTDYLDIRIGARFDDYEQKLVNRRLDESDANRVSEYAKNQVSPQLGLVYKTSEALSIYATYGENFRPLSGATATNNLDPNQSESVEAGVKFSLNNAALEGTIALFKVEQSNISAFTDPDDPTGIGAAESQGLEFDMNGQIAAGLSLWVSYAYVDAQTTETFPDVDQWGEIPAGSRLLNIPQHQFSLQLVKQTQLAGKDLELIGGVLYVGERNGFLVKQDFMLPSYTTARFALSYQILDSVVLRAECNNLFDEEHYTNSYADTWVQPGTPRNFRLSAALSF